VCRDEKKRRDEMEQKGQKHHVMLAVARGMLEGAPNSHSEESSDYQLLSCRRLSIYSHSIFAYSGSFELELSLLRKLGRAERTYETWLVLLWKLKAAAELSLGVC